MPRFRVVLICLALVACREEAKLVERPRDVPVFIVSIDATRADRLPAYGYAAGSTPVIDEFRRDAILYRWAFSNAPMTLPSHASILTGELPPVHGIRNDVGYELSPEAGTIATTLRQLRYTNGAAVSSYVLRHETGIGEGFEFYDDRVGAAQRPAFAERDGDESRVALTAWLESAAGKRIFGFLHLNEPHAPHVIPAGYGRGGIAYDNEISYADAVFGRFLETLRRLDLYDDALIILLSDHGEGLGDHGEDEHGLFVYRESIHVPLLVKLPRRERAGETVTRAVGLNEIRDLVLAVTRGRRDSTLLAKSAPPPAVYSETYYPRVHFGWRELRSIITNGRHLIDAKRPELYDYRGDPAETRNLARAESRAVATLTQVARAADSGFTPPTHAADGPAHLVSVQKDSGPSVDRPDPREKVQIVRDLSRAVRFYEARRYRDAVPLLERVVFYEPAIVEGWAMLGRSRAGAGQRSLALEAYREGLRRFPNNAELALLAATEHANGGNWVEAERLAGSVMQNDPVLAHEALAQFAMKRGDIAAARTHAEAVVRHAPGRIPTLMLLADLSRRESRPADQLMWLDRAMRELSVRNDQPREDLQARRGQALAALGRVSDAEAAYREEVARFPANTKAWTELAVLLASNGRRDEAREVLIAAIRANETAEMRQMARQALQKNGDVEGMSFIEARLPRR